MRRIFLSSSSADCTAFSSVFQSVETEPMAVIKQISAFIVSVLPEAESQTEAHRRTGCFISFLSH
jgi:hypothetical protein